MKIYRRTAVRTAGHATPYRAIPRHTTACHSEWSRVAVRSHRPAIHRYEQKYQCPFRELLACSHSYAECTHSDYTEHTVGKIKGDRRSRKHGCNWSRFCPRYLPIFMSPARPQPSNSRCHAVGNNELWLAS